MSIQYLLKRWTQPYMCVAHLAQWEVYVEYSKREQAEEVLCLCRRQHPSTTAWPVIGAGCQFLGFLYLLLRSLCIALYASLTCLRMTISGSGVLDLKYDDACVRTWWT